MPDASISCAGVAPPASVGCPPKAPVISADGAILAHSIARVIGFDQSTIADNGCFLGFGILMAGLQF